MVGLGGDVIIEMGGRGAWSYNVAISEVLIPYAWSMYGISVPRLPSLAPATKKEKPELRSLSLRCGGGDAGVTIETGCIGCGLAVTSCSDGTLSFRGLGSMTSTVVG